MTRRLRIFQLIKGLGRGGAERLLANGAPHLDRERFEYGVGYFLPHKDQLVAEIESSAVEVSLFPARSSAEILLATPGLTRFLRAWRPDVLHCHLPLAGIAGRLVARRLGIPLLYTEHNLFRTYHPLTRWTSRRTWRWQALVVAVSEAVAESLREIGGKVPVEVVNNGVDIDRLRRSKSEGLRLRRSLGVPKDAPLVGQVAVFRAQKRLDLWLRAAAQVAQIHPSARFLLVGDGPERPSVEALARELGLADRLLLPGLQDDVQPYYSALDVFLLSSDYEGLPVAVLEAMAASLPVVATAVGGIPGVVVPGRTGHLVHPGEPRLLAEAVNTLIERPDERRRLGDSGREHVAKHHAIAGMVARYESLYTAVAESSGVR